MGTLKSVSPPQHSNRSTILKVSPMVTEVTFAPLHKHNTCTVLKLLCLPVMTKNSIFLPLQCCFYRLFLATHPLTGAELVHLFYWFPTCLGLLLFPWFFFSLFAGLMDSAAALDTGTFFCCFASMDFRMLMLVFLVKFPDRNGGKNIF